VPFVGSIREGVWLDFTSLCGYGTIVVAELTYQLDGMSKNCSTIGIEAFPGDETPLVYPCIGGAVSPFVAPLIVNFDHYNGCDNPVPVRETTWGRVKALYR
jgi:hypothetical protein